MKKLITIIFLAFITLTAFAQSGLDKSLAEISSDLADKLRQKGKKKVVVLFVTDINKATTVAGKYIADVVSINIVNNSGDFQVFDRENLSSIAEAKKLIAEGYIDVDQAKELGRLLSVEAIIIGNYTVLSNTIKLTMKALDANTGFIISASMKDLLFDGDAGALLGINVTSANDATNSNNSNRGFNRPLNSDEFYNNPETVNKECESKNTGDYCFSNLTKDILRVEIGGSILATLRPGQTQCFYNFSAQVYYYTILGDKNKDYGQGITYSGPIYSKGSVLVEKCKSKTLSIK